MVFIINVEQNSIAVLNKKKIKTQLGNVVVKKKPIQKQSNIKKKGRNFAD